MPLKVLQNTLHDIYIKSYENKICIKTVVIEISLSQSQNEHAHASNEHAHTSKPPTVLMSP